MNNQPNTNQQTAQSIPDPELLANDQPNDQGQTYELVFTDPEQNIENRFPIAENQEITIGAGYDNDVLVEDQYMSSKHFSVNFHEGIFEVKDLQSKNGLFVKLEQKPFETNPGQVILAGKTKFRIEQTQP